MNCSKCGFQNEEQAKYCEQCGTPLFEMTKVSTEDSNIFVSISALLLVLFPLIYKIHHKIFLLIYGGDDYYKIYETVAYRITGAFLAVLQFAIPVTLVIVVKNVKLKILIIVLAIVLLIPEVLAQFDVLNWNSFWYQP